MFAIFGHWWPSIKVTIVGGTRKRDPFNTPDKLVCYIKLGWKCHQYKLVDDDTKDNTQDFIRYKYISGCFMFTARWVGCKCERKLTT